MASLFFDGDTEEECVAWVSALYEDQEFKDKAELIEAQVRAIMLTKGQSRPYPEFLTGSRTRVYLRDDIAYAFDIERGLICNIATKQIIQENKNHKIKINGKARFVHNEELRACIPKPDHPQVSSDHINRDHYDHRFENLRWGSASLQSTNQHKHESNVTPSIEAKKAGEEWKLYRTRKVFVEQIGLTYDSNSVKQGHKASERKGYIRRPNGCFTQGTKGRSGYYNISIRGSRHKVHILTTNAFHGLKTSEKMQANHKRGVFNGPADAADLGWTTPSENAQHAHDTGLTSSMRAVVVTLNDGFTQRFNSGVEAARWFKEEKGVVVQQGHIAAACNGKAKTHGKMTWAYADGTKESKKRKFIDDE
ncbi:hypothetical protein JKP88DRAFT_241054 [Tribonema minus]|uniref:PH domain-containing protein n=1 Tax=Tribonema minus TaxID=303371 RepID=A0A836CI64_9STRA|nr:hypothetical protein JKP88DRAFT_241054 [Tribonema minus]